MATEKTRQQKEAEANASQYPLWPSTRLAVTCLLFFGGTAAMVGRVQTGFAVLCMAQDQPANPIPADNTTAAVLDAARYQGEFVWSKQFQGVVLSSYFYGYVAALVVGGWVADRYPSHKVAIFSALAQAVLMALMPEATRLHPYSIVVLRVIQGVVASVFYPCFNVILRNWSKSGEFALLFSIAWCGGYLGSAASFPMSSALCQSDWLGGWPAIFYVSSLALLVWVAAACFALTESPENNRFVSETEKKCLMSQTHVQTADKGPTKPVSIFTLLRNLQVWIIALSYFTTSWFFAALNITLPTFMKEGFNFDITENGFMSSMPSLSMGVLMVFGGKAYEYIHVRKGVSKTNSRKILSAFGLLVPSACMIAVILLPASQRYLSVVLISLAQGVSGVVICSGPVSAAPDIAPQYIGFIWGIAASFGNTTGFLTPMIAVAMTPNGTLQEWCWFFAISIVQMLLLTVLICSCWKSEIQPFAKREDLKDRVQSQRHANAIVALEEMA